MFIYLESKYSSYGGDDDDDDDDNNNLSLHFKRHLYSTSQML